MSGGDDSHSDSLKVNREEEEEETFSFLKSTETSRDGWHGCVPLWHQASCTDDQLE